MKQSDSATSLTNLVVCDTACYFCNESGDAEEGRPVVDMKKFLNCECRLTAHTQCWLDHLSNGTESPVSCPLCKTSIAGWKKREASDTVRESSSVQKACITYKCMCRGVCYSMVSGVIVTIVVLCLKISGRI